MRRNKHLEVVFCCFSKILQNSKAVVPLMFANMGRCFFECNDWLWEAGSWADADDEAHPDRSTQKQEAWWPAVEANWSLGKEGRSESDGF